MVRPPMFSRCVGVRHEQARAPLGAPDVSMRRLTAGAIAALVALTVVTLVLAALVGMMAGLAPTLTTDAPHTIEAEAAFSTAFAHADVPYADMPPARETAQP